MGGAARQRPLAGSAIEPGSGSGGPARLTGAARMRDPGGDSGEISWRATATWSSGSAPCRVEDEGRKHGMKYTASSPRPIPKTMTRQGEAPA